ncbi:type II toxin-antitoxin system RelE/ParE family toxin (plasmid) [Agrobacterium tumefaciens]|uniref:type II toxin-antitoxin system RelE/ParE family toxin n=1 Tax=Agrobacterium tumefaciens TaxID=358 RepID=UPI001571BB4B|nr:type II toxin-antitoxin system RelE/ParE family toxin [Agrobacterium tumefaciens]NSZ66624.1 type II toxin-antitoxin system RelE/ParE family toxin [Agrobacterium tumefaciens]NTA72996.1 type II toxin-antitoxin system RelE/ParE family toxin [Agrobacterium tumefaciens]WIE41543.1 type II toxin-antitoxin system RelE/ParE family toxin [Agrobacterium tumefaciens]
MTAYILTAEAESDLRSVTRYTRTQWGAAQVRHYVSDLEPGIATLAEGTGSFKDMSALYPALRMARCQHHYVFCLPREDAPALIVAIFHERMDLIKRLVDRLEE